MSEASDGVAVRRIAAEVLGRIDEGGAYANLALRPALDRSGLSDRDRAFVTELVYGATRMRRACDHLVDAHLRPRVEPRVRQVLRIGAYQLAFADVAAHAGVHATVGAAPKPARGLVNAVLRRIADDVVAGVDWPSPAVELSFPDWIHGALLRRLGPAGAVAAMRAMDLPATTHVRDDGYVQDLASQAVVDAVEAGPGQLVLDACAAPGGKATGLASTGATVVAGDTSASRLGLVAANATRLGQPVACIVADAGTAPFPPARFDRVLLDAPCSGLGVLRRRPDARWRIDVDAPERLGVVQRRLLAEAARLVAPGGLLVYSVCTLTEEENDGVVDGVALGRELEPLDRRTIVPDATSDGMYLARWRRRAP